MKNFIPNLDNVDGWKELPKEIQKYLGCPDFARNIDPHTHGYPSYMPRALERQQLDRAILVCDETVEFLYGDYTPKTVQTVPGTRPLLEAIVNAVCSETASETERAKALVGWRRANVQHLGICGLGTEEEILLGGYSMCHDAARTLVILCQVAGLPARLIIGLNETRADGHTLTEVYADGAWHVFDPSPSMPFAWLETPEGHLASGWDIHQAPGLPATCRSEFPVADQGKRYGSYFADFRLVNYPLEVSNRYQAQRFMRMAVAQKIVQNYDYTGHLNHQPLSGFADLDDLANQWVAGTLTPTPKRYG